MSAISIKGLKVQACHGVLESEKSNPQLFVFDINIDCDVAAAQISDDVRDTVDYAAVCALVSDYCSGNCFNLIERLAHGAAELIMRKFSKIRAVEVIVHKPQAPIGLPFEDVAVTARSERNVVILSLGSSEGDKRKLLDGALRELSETDGLKLLKVSDYIATAPYGGVAKNSFLNCVASFECLLSPDGLIKRIHDIEEEYGRVRNQRWGDRTLDIDIVFFGNKIVESEGVCIPHPDYFNRDFVLIPLKQIAPDFVCPLKHKRISDL